ncbi:MAG: hypothetical protein ACLPYY_06720 [Acidimicrobiales bacterium]
MPHQPDGAAFDVVLLLHVGCVVVGLVTTLAAATTAGRLRRLLRSSAPLPETLRRYFRPGVNWAGRVVYGIPVFGFALLAMSQGAYALGESWVLAGLAIFAAAALLAEGVLWPAERRLQAALAAAGGTTDTLSDAASVGADATAMARAGGVTLLLLLAGIVVMVAQP